MFRFRVPLLLLSFLLIAFSAEALPPTDLGGSQNYKIVDNTTFIGANSIMMFVTNHGNFGRDLAGVFGYDYGTWYPFTDTTAIRSNIANAGDHSPLYASGLWLGGIDASSGQILLAMAEYSDEYVPGPMQFGTFQTDRPEFKVYKLYRDSLSGNPNADYLNWPVDQGAPVNSLGQPRMWGDQMLWCAYNDADPYQHTNDAGGTAPLGIEVNQTVWASHEAGAALDHLIYIQYKLYNKGNRALNDFYFSLWVDPDLGNAGDDLVGCDTLDHCFFCFNAANTDSRYGSPPPAIGFKMLAGPAVPSPGDTAYWDGHLMPGYRNLDMSSFQIYLNGTDPYTVTQTFNYMRGLTRDGYPNPNGSKFAVPGDPVAGTGELDTTPTDKRMMGTFGPISTFNPGDSQCVLIEMAVGQGTDRLNSITVTKSYLNSGQPPLPVTPKTTVSPEPVLYIFSYAVNPIELSVNLGYDAAGGIGKSFDPNSLCMNSICSFDSVRTVPSLSGFAGEVTQMYMPARQFINLYGPLWDSASYPYTVSGTYSDGEPFSLTGQVVMIGHRSGDLNSDGVVDVSDLVYMIEYFFGGGPAPTDLQSADMNHDGAVGISDMVQLVEYMF